MNKISNFFKWMIKYFYWLSLVVFAAIYIRWFQLTPLVFEYYNDPNGAYIFGLILLSLYSASMFALKLSTKSKLLRGLLYIPTTLFFIWNISHTTAFFPSLEFTTRCNGNKYYIAWMHPFGDYQWTFDEVTIWRKGFFKYDSFFFGYSGGPYRIVCDEQNKTANIVNDSSDVLAYIDGENPQVFDDFATATLNNHHYFLARKCNNWTPSTCESLTFTLYACTLEYKSCHPLPIQYTQLDTRNFLHLEPDNVNNEVRLYEELFETDKKILIFGFGQNSQCYAMGCEILEQK